LHRLIRRVITGAVKGKLVVKAGEAVELTATAKASGTVTVKPGGALAVDGATLSGSLSASKAALLRICGGEHRGSGQSKRRQRRGHHR
jgi:hypothetical protein